MHAIDLTLNDSVHTVNNCAIEPRPCPTFFLFNNPLHSYVHHNLEEKMLLLPLHYDFKRKDHTKWNFCHRLLTLISFQTCTIYFLLWNTKKAILKNAGSQTFSVPIDVHCMENKYNIIENWIKKQISGNQKSSFVFRRRKKCIQVWINTTVSHFCMDYPFKVAWPGFSTRFSNYMYSIVDDMSCKQASLLLLFRAG